MLGEAGSDALRVLQELVGAVVDAGGLGLSATIWTANQLEQGRSSALVLSSTVLSCHVRSVELQRLPTGSSLRSAYHDSMTDTQATLQSSCGNATTQRNGEADSAR